MYGKAAHFTKFIASWPHHILKIRINIHNTIHRIIVYVNINISAHDHLQLLKVYAQKTCYQRIISMVSIICIKSNQTIKYVF